MNRKMAIYEPTSEARNRFFSHSLRRNHSSQHLDLEPDIDLDLDIASRTGRR